MGNEPKQSFIDNVLEKIVNGIMHIILIPSYIFDFVYVYSEEVIAFIGFSFLALIFIGIFLIRIPLYEAKTTYSLNSKEVFNKTKPLQSLGIKETSTEYESKGNNEAESSGDKYLEFVDSKSGSTKKIKVKNNYSITYKKGKSNTLTYTINENVYGMKYTYPNSLVITYKDSK